MVKARGKLIGVGVGPGDPGMVTVDAVEAIRAAEVIAFPIHKAGAGSRALDAAAPYIVESVRRLPLLMPMTRDRARLESAHAEAIDAIDRETGAGADIVYLALGDPLFYSTFGYLAARFPGEVEVISGVSAMSAMAAAAVQPLAERDIPTVVVTGKDREGLRAALDMDASVIVIKPRSLAPESLDLLESRGALERTVAAVELGGPGEQLRRELDRKAVEALPYFAILWITPLQGGTDVR